MEKLIRAHQSTFIRLGVMIALASLGVYFYIEKQNELASLKMKLPSLAQEIHRLREENQRLQYEVDGFESPCHLMELARKPEFSHLKHPLVQEVLAMQEGLALNQSIGKPKKVVEPPPFPLAVGAK